MSIARKTLIGTVIGSTVFIVATAFLVAVVSFNSADKHLEQQTKDQLISGRELLDEELTQYLSSIKQNIITYSNNEMIVNAADQFKRSFSTFKNGPIAKGISADDLRQKLLPYYRDEYGSRYRDRNPNSTLSAQTLLNGISDDALYAQYYFIQDNPNPLGEKDAMLTPNLRNSYARSHTRFHPYIRQYLQEFSYYDIFIIEPENGNIIYSVFKELDYGTSLLNGPYADSGLADVFREAVRLKDRDGVAFSPFRAYTPSYEDPASFIASPIQDNTGRTIAVLAFQMPIDVINDVMTHKAKWAEKGFGETGETYMVGENLTIQNMSRELVERPDSYFANLEAAGYDSAKIETIRAKGTSVGYQTIDTAPVKKALAGEKGYGVFENAFGKETLTAYSGLTFEGYQFALIYEKTLDEAFAFRGEIITSVVTSTIVIAIIILGIIGFLVWRATSSLASTLNSAVNVAETVATGQRAEVTGLERDDEIGALMQALERMQSELITGFEKRAEETARITQALDVANTNLMLADANLDIIYMNQSAKDLFHGISSDLSSHAPQFDSSSPVGQNLSKLNVEGNEHQGVLANLSDTFSQELHVGSRTILITANPVNDQQGGRIGTVIEWLDRTEELAKQEEERRIASENLRIKQALDNVSSNVMVADADRKIIYANNAVVKTLGDVQGELRKELSHFDVNTMVGQNIDIFHKKPEHQMKLIDQLNGEHRAKIKVGELHMALTMNPVKDENGNRLGTVLEWQNQTQEVKIQNEIDTLIAAANEGKLDERMDLNGKDGFFKQVGEGLNAMIDGTANFVGDMGKIFGAMADGDLTKIITADYRGEFEDIKGNANASLKRLTEVMAQIQEASSNVRSSANEIAQGTDDLSRRTESQASSLEETASSMEELTATVKQTADSAVEASELANDAKDKAQSGGEVVQEAVNAMSEILDSSNKINDIIGVIDEIAFQTNLLALNAAVEAARAGEQGRGFAVVAGEVRTLSQRSAAAAKEIKDLIRDSVSKVESGSTLVNQSGKTLSEIVESVQRVATVINDVSNAAKEQNAGITQVNQAVTQMDEMTQQNAALVEESSAASRSMSEEATSMYEKISFFQLGEGSSIKTYSRPVTMQAPASEPMQTYKPAEPSASAPAESAPATSARFDQASGDSWGGAASFSEDDEWEEF